MEALREKSAIYNLMRALKNLVGRNNNQNVYAGHMKTNPKKQIIVHLS